MKKIKESFARYKNRKPYFAACEVNIECPSTRPGVVIDCNGYGFAGQGYVESVPLKRYDDWKTGAKVGVEFALSIVKLVNCRVIVTEIEGLTTDTNPTIVGFAAALAVWKALEFSPPREIIEELENKVFESWKNPEDEVPTFI